MDEMVEHSLALKDDSVFPMPHRNYVDRPYDYGLKRFSFEHWVGSHPKLKPCDVYPDSTYAYGFYNLDTTATTSPVWEKAPAMAKPGGAEQAAAG